MNNNWAINLRSGADEASGACPAATGTNAAHCWHDRGQWTDSAGTHRSRQCCHCGEFRQERVPPPMPLPPAIWQQPKHGPHAPEVRWIA